MSVVIPTYNRRTLVPRAIDSVLAQTLRDLEVIVVDDGSTDGTREELQRCYRDEPRLRVVRRENGGVAAARNLGIEQARAELVALLDSDDRWLPGYLHSQAALLRAQPDASLVVGNGQMHWHDGTLVALADWPGWRMPDSMEAMLAGAWTVPSFTVIRTDVARRLRFDELTPVVEDTDFLFRFNQLGLKCILNPEVLAEYGGASEQDPSEPRAHGGWDVMRLALYDLWRRYSDGYPDLLTRPPWREWFCELLPRSGRLADARHHLWQCWRARPYDPRPLWELGRMLRSNGR